LAAIFDCHENSLAAEDSEGTERFFFSAWEEKCMDVIVTYERKKFIIELKAFAGG